MSINSKMTAIANAIREKTGGTDVLTLDGMASAISTLKVGGAELPTLTKEGTASDLLYGKELIDAEGNIVTGTMADNGAISSTMDGITTKSVSVPAGYTAGGIVSLTDDIDNEVTVQSDLIAQIMTELESKARYNTIYIGSAEPTDDIGVNGDIYIVRSDI